MSAAQPGSRIASAARACPAWGAAARTVTAVTAAFGVNTASAGLPSCSASACRCSVHRCHAWLAMIPAKAAPMSPVTAVLTADNCDSL